MVNNLHLNNRITQVHAWLEKNVTAPSTPSSITLSKIRFNWKKLSGSFQLSLDNQPIKDQFDLSINIAGEIKFCPPMFCSPLGTPASFAAVELDRPTQAALERALKGLFPRLRGIGRYADLGLEISTCSPLRYRIIDPVIFEQQRARMKTRGFTHTEPVEV
jgi:hypothetical protein